MRLTCDFCYHHCTLESGQKGLCETRVHVDGHLATIGYGEVIGLSIDAIEKKPLYHFLPASHSLSFALHGCNLSCEFCQNYQLSQPAFKGCARVRKLKPEQLVALAKERGTPSISYTYSEPLVWQDYMIDVAKLAHKKRLKNVMVTNGSFSEESLSRLDGLIDAYNIDVKGDEDFYRTICHGSLKPVLAGLEYLGKTGVHIEVTTMLIEGIHTKAMVQCLANELAERNVQVWHLSRFFPQYHFGDRKETSEQFLDEVYTLAKQSGIPYIYHGNSEVKEDTECPFCHSVVIGRDLYGRGFDVILEKGLCPICKHPIYGVYQ